MEDEPGLSDQDSDAGSEEVLTPAELISKLEEAWLNEKFAPELLESKSEIVECVMEQLNHMIETFFPHVLEKEKSRGEDEPPHLSPEEFAFAKEYMTNTETLLKNVALRHMPPNLQSVDLLKCVPKPNLDSFVFLKVKQAQESILVEPETDEQSEYTIDMEVGSQHLIRYRTIAPLVASGAVNLI
ncbi:DNA replication complex GINS protein SLD5 isoform X2 [Dendrobates tinctorius]|uniref:DNA replication complex GINS protein SLD5 isoform X2 n=1 Tax=Dendrobates tinctorius TaxID=92724 RepID=UPI003CC9A6B6